MAKALLLVDPQIDFISGSLPVPGAEKAMDALASFLLENRDRYSLKLITLDWHPWNHFSFSPNGGQWPVHCVAYDQGAAVWPTLMTPLHTGEGDIHFLPKGQTWNREEYSIFQNVEATAQIRSVIQEHRITDIDLCGLAGDVCVLNTFRDGIMLDLPVQFKLLREFSPSLDGGKALDKLMEKY